MKPIWTAVIAAGLALLGLFGPFSTANTDSALAKLGTPFLLLGLAGLVLAISGRFRAAMLLVPTGLLGAFLALQKLMTQGADGAWGYWTIFWAYLLMAMSGIGRISLSESSPAASTFEKRLKGLLPPVFIPFFFLLIWQGLVSGYQVPKGIFPGVNDTWTALGSSGRVLLQDSYVTFIKEVLFGFVLGLGAGLLTGIAIAYSIFLQRGFLPLAAAFGAVPIVGLAPVLGRAFGVDWESKAAVVVIVTFFPVVLNTVQGLTLIEPLKLELLKAYAAKPWEVFLKLRLPNSLPYLFNALKLAAVISVISVIVAEFLIPGPPEGLGQRISLSARRGAYDIVFAAIIVSSTISIVFYGLLSVLERRLTAWHASFREEP